MPFKLVVLGVCAVVATAAIGLLVVVRARFGRPGACTASGTMALGGAWLCYSSLGSVWPLVKPDPVLLKGPASFLAGSCLLIVGGFEFAVLFLTPPRPPDPKVSDVFG